MFLLSHRVNSISGVALFKEDTYFAAEAEFLDII